MELFRRVYAEVDAKASRHDKAETPARAALLVGVAASATLLALGLLVLFLRNEPRPAQPPGARALLSGILEFRGVSFLYLGLLLLAATPVLRVMVMIGVYLRRREWFMAAVSLTVLTLLALGLFLGTG